MGEIGIHGEVGRVPGALSLAYRDKPGQSLIVPAGNEKECALILMKPGHDGCGVFAVSTLDEVIGFFSGKRTLDNALREKVTFEPAFESALDFGRIKGQKAAREAAIIWAAGGHNLLMVGPFTPPGLVSRVELHRPTQVPGLDASNRPKCLLPQNGGCRC
jgi:magnesium chelatase family protein